MSGWRSAAVDLGAASGRVVVGELDGSVIRLSEAHRFPNAGVRAGRHLHWDALRLFSEILDGLARARKTTSELASVGVDTWGVDFALLDRSGALLGNPHHYRDARTEGMVERVAEKISDGALFESTGLQTMRINTLFQLVAAQQMAPGLLELADRLLMMPDLFHYWLCGEAAGERCIATTSQLFDPRRSAWSTAVLEALDLPTELFPTIVLPGSELGPLLPAVRDATGLERTRVIAPASHDTASAVAAIPSSSDRWAYISSGTWSLMGVVSPQPVVTEAVRTAGFTNEGGVAGTTRLLKNITGLWLVQECRRSWAKAGDDLDYPALTALAEQYGPFDAVVDPDHPSLLSPDDMPQALTERCQATGEKVPRNRAELLRVALESLACKYRQTLDQLEAITGHPFETIHVVGGGSKNTLLCQLTADLCDRPVFAGPVETTALGNLLAQALAAGVIGSWDEARSLVRQGYDLQQFHPRDSARWQSTYHRFKAKLERDTSA